MFRRRNILSIRTGLAPTTQTGYITHMEIICTDREDTAYFPMFGGAPIPMTVATVDFPEHDTIMTLSHRADDPEGMWLADSRISNGMPVFVHGPGDRSCNKQIAGPEIVAAIENYKG